MIALAFGADAQFDISKDKAYALRAKQVISNLAAVHGRALKPPFDSKEEPMKSIYLSIVGTPTAAWRLAKTTAFIAGARGHCPCGCPGRAD